MTRIAFITPGLEVGGAEIHTVQLREHLMRVGYQSSLIVHGPKISDAILAHPGAKDAILLNLKGMSDLGGWFKVRRELRENFDVIIAINQTALTVAVVNRALRVTNAKTVCIFHTTALLQHEHRSEVIFRSALRSADRMVYVAEHQRRYWESRGLRARKSVVIRNGIDLDKYEYREEVRTVSRAKLGFAPDDFVIGIIASLRPEKNHGLAIRALGLLREQGAQAKLLLVGDGEMRAAIERDVIERGLGPQVVFAGEQRDVTTYLPACDVGVLTTESETMPLAALEFMAAGRPMVMSHIDAAAEIIGDSESGLLFKLDAPDPAADLASNLSRLLAPDFRARMGERAHARAKDFSLTRMMSQYEELLTELAPKP